MQRLRRSADRRDQAVPGRPLPHVSWPLTLAGPCTAPLSLPKYHQYAVHFAMLIKPNFQYQPWHKPWLHRNIPHSHNLTLLLDTAPSRCCTTHVWSQVGFRDVRVAKRQLLVNGRPVMIKGVNRHEHDERRGKAITEVTLVTSWQALSRLRNCRYPIEHVRCAVCAERQPQLKYRSACRMVNAECCICVRQASMVTDIRLMKQLNFNAVRASHYPNHTRWCVQCQYDIATVASPHTIHC